MSRRKAALVLAVIVVIVAALIAPAGYAEGAAGFAILLAVPVIALGAIGLAGYAIWCLVRPRKTAEPEHDQEPTMRR